MEMLWSSHEAPTSAEVAARAGNAHGWSQSTVRTMLSRLATNLVVSRETRGRTFFHRAAVERSACAAGESRRLLNRLFKGRVTPLVAHLAQADSLSSGEIAELEALLKNLQA